MNITNLKDKKPWFVPKWLWNQLVNQACDAARENLKVDKMAGFVVDASMDGLQKAIYGKDPKVVETVCTTVENGSKVFIAASNAARDGNITDEEKAEVGGVLTTTVSTLLPQERIDAKIEEIRCALLFG